MQGRKLTEKEKTICQQAKVDSTELETAIEQKDAAKLKSIVELLQKFLAGVQEKFAEEKKTQQEQMIKLVAALIASLQRNLEEIQREQTRDKFNKGKQKSVIEQLFDKLKVLEKEGVVISWLSQGEKRAEPVVVNQDAIDTTKQTIKVKFENGTELHVHPIGISVPNPSHINEQSIPQIAKTAKAAGTDGVKINPDQFPEKDRKKLVKQLCDELEKLNIAVLNKSELTQEKAQKKTQKQTSENDNKDVQKLGKESNLRVK